MPRRGAALGPQISGACGAYLCTTAHGAAAMLVLFERSCWCSTQDSIIYDTILLSCTAQGRHILWGYMKELRNVPAPPCLCNKFSYSGCTSLPRALYLKGDRLFQVGAKVAGSTAGRAA